MADLDEETIAFAHRMFDLARSGDTRELIDNVTAGLPVNLTNDNGDTLLILAAYHQHAETVTALLGMGADPNRVNDRGQSALDARSPRPSWTRATRVGCPMASRPTTRGGST